MELAIYYEGGTVDRHWLAPPGLSLSDAKRQRQGPRYKTREGARRALLARRDAERRAGVEWYGVTSSNVTRVAFEAGLLVEFASGGVYRYPDVPRELFEELLVADADPELSVGRFVNTRVRGEYEHERMSLDEEEG